MNEPLIRDLFAVAALHGLLTGRNPPVTPEEIRKAAEYSYDVANAMLEARKP
jgi:hypothetical protein